MRVLFDIVHPAHVHFFKHMIRELERRGHLIRIIARNKDVTTALLDRLGFRYLAVGHPRSGRIGQLRELMHRDRVLVREIRQHGIDVVVTRNPTGVHAARFARAFGIFDTDDGWAAGVHFAAARPFAHVITSPDCLRGDWGTRHVKYRGYKQLAYLHPDHFTPDASVLTELGIERDEPFFLVRFVSMAASHDHGEMGISMELKRELVKRLVPRGRVIISSETAIGDDLRQFAYRGPPDRILDLMAFARLVVGDSQTMAAEAAVLGTPSVRLSTFAGRLDYLEELERTYGLTYGYHPRNSADFFMKLDELISLGRECIADGHRRMLQDKVNVATWYTDFIESVGRRS